MRWLSKVAPWLFLCSASCVWGQYGTAGSPGLLWTPQTPAAGPGYYAYPTTSAAPAVYDVPAAQSVPVAQDAPTAGRHLPPASSFSKSTSAADTAAEVSGPQMQPMMVEPQMAGPQFGPPAAGPQMVGPQFGPPMAGPQIVGPQMVGPQYGSPMAGPQMVGPQYGPQYSPAPAAPTTNVRPQFAYVPAVPYPAMQSAAPPPSAYAPAQARPGVSSNPNRNLAQAPAYRYGLAQNTPVGPQPFGNAPTPGMVEGGPRPEAPHAAPGGDCGCSAGGGPTGTACGGDCCEGSCGDCCREPWYATVESFFMFRDAVHFPAYSYYDTGDPGRSHLTPSDVNSAYSWGGEVRLGRRFCGEQWAVEGSYWGLQPIEGQVRTPAQANNIDLSLNGSQVQIWNPNSGTWNAASTQFLTGANQQQYSFRSEMHNVEVNLVDNVLGGRHDSTPWDVQFLLGARFFRFEDRFSIDSAYGVNDQGFNRTFSNLSAADNAWVTTVSEHTTNDLWGGQMGLFAAWYVHPSVKFFASSKFGVFNNHMEGDFDIHQWNGLSARQVNTNGAVVGGYPIHAVHDDIALLAQLDVGVDWNFACNWSARFGYRLMGVSGVGLATEQIPVNLHDLGSATQLQHNSDLVLHGAFCGINWNF